MPNFKKNPAPFMMKNSALHASAKYGSPMQANYDSPMKDDKKKKKKEKKTSDDVFVHPIDRSTEEEKKKAFEKIPFLGPAPINPDPDSFINAPKQYLTGTTKKTTKKKK